MIKRLLSFLDASPVNFLAVKNISEELEKNGFRRMNPQEPLGKIEAGEKFFVTKNDSSIYAFQIGKKPLADAGFHMICAHCDSPTFRIKPNAEMLCEGGIVKLNTEVYGGPIMSTWFDRPLTLAGRVIVKGENAMNPQTLLLHVKRPLLQISNLAIHFNRQVNDGVKLSKQKDVLPILGIINDELEKGNLLMNVITDELNIQKEDVLDFDLYLADATPACTFGVHDEFISSGRLDDPTVGYFGNQELEIPFRLLDKETADMMDMTKAVQLEIRGAQQTTNTEGDIEFRPMRVVVRGRGGKLTTGKVKAGSPMDTAITLTILYILIEVDGKTVVELDKLNEVYKVNGVDVLAKIKEMC